jgi:hypothetical protein
MVAAKGHRMFRLPVLFAVLVVVFLPINARLAAAEPPKYQFVDLSVISNDKQSVATSVNSSGAVLYAGVGQGAQGVRIWKPAGPQARAGAVFAPNFPEKLDFEVKSLNDHGQILLYGNPKRKEHPGICIWTPEIRGGEVGKVVSLQEKYPDKTFDSTALLLSDGSVIGNYLERQATGPRRPNVKWTPHVSNGTEGTLDVIQDRKVEGMPTDGVIASNSKAVVVGYPDVNKPNSPNLWAPTADWNRWNASYIKPQDKADPATGRGFVGTAISEMNVVAGTSPWGSYVLWLNDKHEVTRAARIDLPKGLLGELHPLAVGDDGTVIGRLDHFKSFVWTEKSGTHDLDTLCEGLPVNWQLRAFAMNRHGVIVGGAYTGKAPPPRGQPLPPLRAFVLLPKN